MLGDKLVIKPHHTKAAEGIYEIIGDRIGSLQGRRIAVTVAGESGSGKSEIASEVARLLLEKNGLHSIIFAQDDYFKLPPKSNNMARREDLNNVGMQEVKLTLLDEHVAKVKEYVKSDESEEQLILKPLINYNKNNISEEVVGVSGVNTIIAEGTYTTSLNNADIKVFIDRTYLDTRQHRMERNRDKFDDYTEKILEIEHDIISSHKSRADIIVNKDYSVQLNR